MPSPLFISHGAPDVFLLDTPAHRALQALGKGQPPMAYIIVSAHWQSGGIRITASNQPATIHDFRGFGDPLDIFDYPVAGAPGLAAEIQILLAQSGILADLDFKRGLDHGAWIPMALIRPEADIPVIQISLPRQSDDASFKLGRALASLSEKNIQLIGSGAITHSLADSLTMPEDAAPAAFAETFRDALDPALKAGDMPTIRSWRSLPEAERNHPTPEHLRPLFFAIGASQTRRGRRLHTSWSRSALAMDIWAFD